MYRSKFKSRKDAFNYTVSMLPKAKSKDKILTNFSNAISTLPDGTPTIIMAKNEEAVIYRAFEYREGEVPINEIVIDGDVVLI